MPDPIESAGGDVPLPNSGSAGGPPSGTEGPRPHRGPAWISPFRVGLALVLVTAAIIGWQATSGSAPLYRTALVSNGTVVDSLTSVGTITPVDQADLDFSVSGTVSTVDVSVGQNVTAGQTLASLDVTDLNADVVSAQASLASAQNSLAKDEASETEASTSPSSSDSTTTTTTTTPSSGSPNRSGTSGAVAAEQRITELQQGLVTAQMQVDADSAQASAALQEATRVCTVTGQGSSSPPSTTSTTTTTTTTSPTTTTTTDPSTAEAPESTTSTTEPTSDSIAPASYPGSGGSSPGSGGSGPPAGCSEALAAASSAQAAVTVDIKKLSQAENALNSALNAALQAATNASSSSTSPSNGSAGHGSSSFAGGAGSGTSSSSADASGSTGSQSGSPTGSSLSSASREATPQQLALDQANIDVDQANLDDAQQALEGVNLVSTISGTVASVTIAPGDSVNAGSSSSTAEIVVIGNGSAFDVTTDVDVTDIGKIAVGQEAQVTPDSTNRVLDGQVESIGVEGDDSSGTTTYPVTIGLDSAGLGQLSGAEADVSIIVKTAVDVTTVPSSAIRTVGSIHLVTVVDGNQVHAVRVSLGTVGPTLTQVTSGVSDGEQVALANLNESLPSTSATTGRFGGLGGAGISTLGGAGGLAGGGGFAGGRGFAQVAG